MRNPPDIWISVPKYTVLLLTDVRNGIDVVVQAPPIARWTVGKTLETVLTYFSKRSDAVIACVSKT